MENWKGRIDNFVQAHQTELAALAWQMYQEKGKGVEILGIDIEPTPHFFVCPRANLEILNKKVHGQIQEILGILDGYHPEKEILVLVIYQGQIKLIDLTTDLTPPECYAQIGENLSEKIGQLEAKLSQL